MLETQLLAAAKHYSNRDPIVSSYYGYKAAVVIAYNYRRDKNTLQYKKWWWVSQVMRNLYRVALYS